MAAILQTALEYKNNNFLSSQCDTELDDKPNINNPCICMLPIGSLYRTPIGRVFLRIKQNTGEVCNDNDWVEIQSVEYVLTDGSRVTNLINLSASTSTQAQINLADGVTKTAPVDGDIWRVGDTIHAYLTDTEYVFDLTEV